MKKYVGNKMQEEFDANFKDNHELRMEYAKLIAHHNEKIVAESGESSDCISFEFEGISIHNPFADTSGMYEVDPIEEYGESFINSPFYNPTIETEA